MQYEYKDMANNNNNHFKNNNKEIDQFYCTSYT